MSATRYETTRDAICERLQAIQEVGVVFKSPRLVQDWETFLQRFVDDTGKVAVTWFSLVSWRETDSALGEYDATGDTNVIQRTERWRIETHYGFHDDDTEPSEYDAQLRTERITDAFRFLQTMGGAAFKVSAIDCTFNGLWMLGGTMCHRSELYIEVVHRIVNPN